MLALAGGQTRRPPSDVTVDFASEIVFVGQRHGSGDVYTMFIIGIHDLMTNGRGI